MPHTTADKLARLYGGRTLDALEHELDRRHSFSDELVGQLIDRIKELEAALREREDAVAAERERCAKIMEGSPWNMPGAAEAIRGGR